MDRTKDAALDMAMKELYMSKDQIVKLALGKNYRGYDFALPQNWVDNNLTEFEKNRMYLMTDCNSIVYKIIDVRDILLDYVADLLIRMANIHAFMSKRVESSSTFQFNEYYQEYQDVENKIKNITGVTVYE